MNCRICGAPLNGEPACPFDVEETLHPGAAVSELRELTEKHRGEAIPLFPYPV